MGDFVKQLSQLSQNVATCVTIDNPPFIHCSKINAFIQLMRKLAPLLGTTTKKLNWGLSSSMKSVNDVLQEFKQLHAQCLYENCIHYILITPIKTAYNQFTEMLKELRKDFDQLGVASALPLIDQALTDLEPQETVDLKRIGEIFVQIHKKNNKSSRKDVQKQLLERTTSLENLGIQFNYQPVDIVVIPELPNSLNLVLQHEDLEFGKQIGEGISGRVVKGKIKSTGMVVAIKILHLRQLSGADMERFRNEIFAMSTLTHPSLLPFCGYTQEAPYCLATKFMENGSLFNILSTNPSFLSPTDRTLIAYDVACGMEFLHSRGVIHRDLKSLNILIDENKRGKISDFGFVRMKSSVPMTGLVGTSHWMAPEILLSSPNYDEKIDIYSYGIVLWELLTSEKPYANENPATLPLKVIEHNLRPTIPEGTPIKMKTLIERCWSLSPEQRPSFHDIINYFTDPEYHFPGSERFVLLRETGAVVSHARNSSENEFLKRPIPLIRRNMNMKSVCVSKSKIGTTLVKRIEDAMNQGHIEAFRNSIATFRSMLDTNNISWPGISNQFVGLIQHAPHNFKMQLVQLFFEILSNQCQTTTSSPNLSSKPPEPDNMASFVVIQLLNDPDPNIIEMSLTILSLTAATCLNTDDVINTLLGFVKSGDQKLRIKALHALLVGCSTEALKNHLNNLLMFGMRKLPLLRLRTLLTRSLDIINSMEAKELDPKVLIKLQAIQQNAPPELKNLTNECINTFNAKANNNK